MESNHKYYSIDESVSRLDEILESSDTSFEELNSIPSRDRLSYKNGFYVNCSCIYMDIRQSSKLTDKYKRPTLAKIYRCYISEAVAILNSSSKCAEINIHGDAVWGVFDTPYKSDIDDSFSVVAQLSSVIDITNCRMKRVGIAPIVVGIGVDYGRALMIKAGYKNSGLNDIVWMGDVVNQAAKLGHQGNASLSDNEIMVSDDFYDNLNDGNKKLLVRHYTYRCYHGNVVNTVMNDWVEKNSK
jgi:class 3 adenylate cyclase